MSITCAQSKNSSAAMNGACSGAFTAALVVLIAGIALAVSAFAFAFDVRLCFAGLIILAIILLQTIRKS